MTGNMTKKMKLSLLALIMALGLAGNVFADDYVVIANKSIAVDAVTAKEAKKIWLGKKKTIPGGGVIKLADLAYGFDTRVSFYKNIVKKKDKQLKAYWAKISFTGKGYPPEVFESEKDVVDWVAKTVGAMGYVSQSAVNDSVKVISIK